MAHALSVKSTSDLSASRTRCKTSVKGVAKSNKNEMEKIQDQKTINGMGIWGYGMRKA